MFEGLYLTLQWIMGITTMATATLKSIEQNDNVGMFSICFDGSEESEFEKFLN